MKASDGHEQPGDRWHLSVLPTLVLVRSANDAGGLDIHSVNAASAASYAQTEWKEASTAAQSGRTKGTAQLPYGSGKTKGEASPLHFSGIISKRKKKMPSDSVNTRLLSSDDLPLILRLLNTSEYIYQRFTLEELPMLLKHYPTVGTFSGDSLRGFLLSQTVNPPSAWIGGFGVSWTESRLYISILEMLLEQLTEHLLKRGVRYLYYSGNGMQNDWLRDVLLVRGFALYRLLYAYDKYDYSVPSTGNPDVKLRSVEKQDIPALLAIEEACFQNFWRYDALSFEDIAATHPYFVVAELNGKVVGYQFNALEDEFGYLVRIAVHPSVNGQGVGVRLMSEAIAFFQQAHVLRIMLNTQDDNVRAHRLYEWFGFVRINQMGFALRKPL